MSVQRKSIIISNINLMIYFCVFMYLLIIDIFKKLEVAALLLYIIANVHNARTENKTHSTKKFPHKTRFCGCTNVQYEQAY